MFKIGGEIKRDPVRRWALSESVFFAAGACHVLAHAFLERYPSAGFEPVWIKPAAGYTGNHIVVVRDRLAFDFHGYGSWPALQDHLRRKFRRWYPGWDASLIPLAAEVLISETLSRRHDGLWLREPGQYLHNATPRARRFLNRFPPPPDAAS